MPTYMTKEEEKEFEKNAEINLRTIRAKLPGATPRQLYLIAGFMRGLQVEGWDQAEYDR